MPLREYSVLSIDPGVTTGFTLGYIEDEHVYLAPFQAKVSPFKLYGILSAVRPGHIICEDFEFRAAARDKLELFSVQLIGICTMYAEGCQGTTKLHMQNASTGKSHFKDAKQLVKYGLYKPGDSWKHSMDAMRHWMQWFMFRYGYKFHKEQQLHITELQWVLDNYFFGISLDKWLY